MPSSTPSPLDQLAGIEQAERLLLDAADYRHCCGDCDATNGVADMRTAADTLATLREVLTEWRDARMLPATTIAELERREQRVFETSNALFTVLITPDSPRQAGEEITDGN